ncbi:MAG: phosphotransferase [Gammaproteobacteria bacterium]|nr:phosphotransferase [Gammaproteobacteria bacterium]
MDARQKSLEHWLKTVCHFDHYILEPLAGDASFRRYFRVTHQGDLYIAMDAPPPRENCLPYVLIANAIRKNGLSAPIVFHQDINQGFLLLSDFGNRLLLSELNQENMKDLYGYALDALAVLQTCRKVDDYQLPLFSAEFMVAELQLFKEWFLQNYLGLTLSIETEKMLDALFHFLAESAASQPQVFMHRDYHSANLMILPNEEIGILDFQDAFIGPVTYDVVSLLRDCYIAWPSEQIETLALAYKDKIQLTDVSKETYLRWFDLMGMQRHLKALLTYARKYKRDQNDNYLQHIPRALNYISHVANQYSECAAFNVFLNAEILPALKKVTLTCEQ